MRLAGPAGPGQWLYQGVGGEGVGFRAGGHEVGRPRPRLRMDPPPGRGRCDRAIAISGRQAVLEALANSKPGRRKDQIGPELEAVRDEVQRLGEVVKEQAVELVALRTKSRWG